MLRKDAPVALEAGTRVGRYTISRLLAQGGMAEVYRAEQELTQGISRPVAVKVIRPEYSESADFREMFLDEARTACTLSHPNIAQIYDVGESDDGLLYMAMELVAGETLATINRTLRDQHERFSNEALFAIGIWTASALEPVHALKTEGGATGLVHRDISPHNLLLSATGSLKLIDFGIAKAATNRNLTMPGVTKGKAGYFSPEQAMGKRLDGRSDLFSLGVTLYKLASGSTPFDDHKAIGERHAALVRGQWKDLDEVYPGMPGPFYEVVRRALMLKPEERYQTARAMREALEAAAFDSGLRVGQSSLLGYVDDDGEVTASGGTRSSAFPAITAPPTDTVARPLVTRPPPAAPSATALEPLGPAKGPQTERVPTAKPAPSSRRAMLGLAFGAALAIGVFATLLFVSGPTPPAPPTPVPAGPAPEAPGAVAPPVVSPAPPPPHTLADVPTPTRDEPPGLDRTAPPVPGAPARPPSVRPKALAVKSPPPEVRAPPAPPADDAIPEGIGTIRISVPGDSGAKVVVRSAAKSYVQDQPFNEKVPSGRYTVTVRLANGDQSTVWRGVVRPDQQKKLSYDVAQGRWNEL